MSKGSGTSGSKGGGNTSGRSTRKVNLQITGKRTISGKAIQGLIKARGGVSKLKSALGIHAKSEKPGIIRIKVSHSYRNKDSGGGTDVIITSGMIDVEQAKLSGKTMVRVEVEQLGKRGKITRWTGDVKL